MLKDSKIQILNTYPTILLNKHRGESLLFRKHFMILVDSACTAALRDTIIL